MAARALLVSLLLFSACAAAVFTLRSARGGGVGLPVSVRLPVRKALLLAPAQGDPPAPSCDTLDCPPFKAVHVESDFQIRAYRAAAWVETEPILAASFDKASVVGFRRLFKYIQGDNVEGAQVPMTAPVLTAIKPSGGPFCSSSFTVKFFVPPQYEGNPPKPSEGLGVSVVQMPGRCVAVRRFSGFATDLNVAQEAKLLADSLSRSQWANVTGVHTSGEYYSIAQYNSPFELFNRVNEVWVPFAAESGKEEECVPARSSSASRLALA